jgi:hypothetical protein
MTDDMQVAATVTLGLVPEYGNNPILGSISDSFQIAHRISKIITIFATVYDNGEPHSPQGGSSPSVGGVEPSHTPENPFYVNSNTAFHPDNCN